MQEVVGSTPILSTKAHKSEPFIFMSFSVYIIYYSKLDKYYVGYTKNITLRLTQHNEGISTFTSKTSDWVLRYKEEYENREAAHQRELEIKRKKSRKYIEWLISSVD
jgi:putative endonuclease